jgi:hypothetical protein
MAHSAITRHNHLTAWCPLPPPAGPQDTYSDARQLFVDERPSFSPWHALEDHRPLGGIMRARLKAYEGAREYRAQRNARDIREPRVIEEIPVETSADESDGSGMTAEKWITQNAI